MSISNSCDSAAWNTTSGICGERDSAAPAGADSVGTRFRWLTPPANFRRPSGPLYNNNGENWSGISLRHRKLSVTLGHDGLDDLRVVRRQSFRLVRITAFFAYGRVVWTLTSHQHGRLLPCFFADAKAVDCLVQVIFV